MKLILIHGRDQQGLDEKKLRQNWLDTLNEGLKKNNLSLPADIKVVLPYYGNLIDSLVSGQDQAIPGVVAQGAMANSSFTIEFLSELVANAEASGQDVAAIQTELVRQQGPLNWEWIQAIARALDTTALGGPMMEKFTFDVFTYLTNSRIRATINTFVGSVLDGEPAVVVGHSLGSVVAYNVLRAHTTGPVSKFITVGCPLGMKAIRMRLDTPIRMPECVNMEVNRGWFNAFDDRDFVALKPLNNKNFNILPAIINKDDVNNKTDNRHGIAGYLNDKEVAKVIYEALTDA